MSFMIQNGIVENFTTSIADGTWYTVNFDPAFPDGSQVVVSAQIQTRGGQDTPGLRLRNVSTTGFDVRMEELIASNATSSVVGDLGTLKSSGTHPNAETLGWIATAS